MNTALQIYVILILVGLFLIGAEIFLPGGVIGVFGGFALLTAVVVGFSAFGPNGGVLSALAIIVLLGICLVLWVKYFPRTGMGRRLTLARDGKLFKAPPEELKALLGKEGQAVTDLRPSGVARIDGHRVDVITDGLWIGNGRPLQVIEVEGTRVVVREVSQPPPAEGGT